MPRALRIILDVATSLRMSAGAMLLRTGSQSIIVHRTSPVMVLILSLEKSNLNINLAGDYNLNLLKINVNESCSEFFDLLVSHSLFPKITLPTRHAHDSATLIDNLFCKVNTPTPLSTAGILLNTLSDHQLCFILLETDFAHHKLSKFIKIYKQNDEVIENIIHEISNSEQLNKIDINLTVDPNVSYGIICEVIEKA